MGLFKSFKDMAAMASAAPDLINSAHGMADQARAQQSAAAAMTPGNAQGFVNATNASMFGEPSAAAMTPIAGVDLATYAKVVKGIAAYGHDQAQLPVVAAAHGIAPHNWQAAQSGWGARIQADRALGSRFNQLYTAN